MKIKRYGIVVFIILFILIAIPGIYFIIQNKEEDMDLEHRRYKDISIVSAKKPQNTHLWVETNSSGTIYAVDSTDTKDIIKTTDKAENWSVIESRASEIITLWHDNGNALLYAGDAANVFYVDLSNDSITELGLPDVTAQGYVSGNPYDLYIIAGTLYCAMLSEDGVVKTGLLIYHWNGAAWIYDDEDTHGAVLATAYSYATVSGTDAYFVRYNTTGTQITVLRFDSTGPTVTALEAQANRDAPDSLNQFSTAYDGSDIISFIAEKTADNKDYLHQYSISNDTITTGAEYNIAIQLDRNNRATVPNEFEKAFGISGVSDEIVYELKARRNGMILLQNCSDISDADFIAITDNFLMNNDGDMFEWTDVTNEVSKISYNDGIIGIRKKGGFMADPENEANWSKGDSIKIYDQYDQLEFWGLITEKNINRRGLYVFKMESFTDEIYYAPYEKSYSADDLDTKQKDIIDNGCNFNYRSSSIVGTTMTFDYVYNRAIAYLFFLGRRLERQVPYIEPDGKIWTKAHDGLAMEDMIYGATYNFRDDDDDSAPSGWTIVNGADTETTIITSFGSHRKVMRMRDDSAVNLTSASISFTDTPAADKTVELWLSSTDFTFDSNIQLLEGATQIVRLYISDDNLEYFDSLGALNVVAAGIFTDNIWYHMKIVCDDTANTFDVYIDGVLKGNNLEYRNNSTVGIDNIFLNTRNDHTGYSMYFDAIASDYDPNYNIGDNDSVWKLHRHWQDVFLIDIPGIEEKIHGFFDGNTGITRNTIRYRNNATSIRPVEATRDPIEQLKGILALNEYRDPKIEDSTESEQLGDNRYAIWSKDTIYIGARVEGQGYLQPGKTIEIENSGQKTITKADFVLLSFLRDPKRDIYFNMILSDNIIFPEEFANLDNTSRLQTHTATVQALENQEDINAHLTKEGGIAVLLTNKTGVASVKGTIVEAHAATDNAFRVCDASSVEPFGIVYEDGIADGEECLVVINGRAQVLLKDATASTRNFWAGVSDVAGRADCTSASPPAAPAHFKEVGHCIESQGADTDVLSYIMLHFL